MSIRQQYKVYLKRRDAAILAQWAKGNRNMAAIGREYDLTRERVRQIVGSTPKKWRKK